MIGYQLKHTLTKRFCGLLAVVCLGLSLTANAAVHPYERWAKELGINLDVSYDGTRVMTVEDTTFEATERRAPGKMYTEVHVGGMSTGIILREDLQKSYILMTSMGFYQEETLDKGLTQAGNGMEFSKIEKLGREPVNGHPSTKYKTRFEDNEGKGSGIVWITDTGVPIKMDMVYSSRSMKDQRIVMQLTELNIRAQDPAYFEVPAGLKPMNMSSLGDLLKMGGAAATAPAAASTSSAPSNSGVSDAQQACLKEAAAQAAAEREKAESKKGFGRLLGAMSRTASRFGLDDISDLTRDAYDANATAEDASVIAEELGITEDAVKRCQQP